ncbi:MAG: hypothetical protein M0Q13_10090 [Methanothrix sp.]|jgi:hypothetical protein|nr:hypothetical protein [Methanothrix sp.]
MKKKKIKKKQLSIIEDSSLGKINNHLTDIKKSVKQHSTGNDHVIGHVLECENNLVKCTDCFYYSYNFFECEWYRENKCTFKCKGYKRNLEAFGFIDINKFKHHNITRQEKKNRRKIDKYLKFAENIDKIYEDELEKINEIKREKLIAQKIKELKELEEQEKEAEPEVKQKRRDIKSLI